MECFASATENWQAVYNPELGDLYAKTFHTFLWKSETPSDGYETICYWSSC